MSSTATPLPPKEDPWYKAPPGFETAKPGTILRIRIAPGNTLKSFADACAAYNILFATTDSNYKPSWGVTTLFVPKVSNNGSSMLSYSYPYNALDVNVSPSYQFSALEIWTTTLTSVGKALAEGWYVNVADHEGPLAAVGDGLVAGHTVLDSVRACLHAGFGMSLATTRTAFWGFSGGAVAAGWAAELQPHYTPELLCAGAALGGIPPDISIVQNSTGGKFAGQTVFILLGCTFLNPDAHDELMAHLLPAKKDDFLSAVHMDIGTLFGKFAMQDIFSYFDNGREIMNGPAISTALKRKGRMGHHGVPTMPLFIYKSIKDEITKIEETDEYVEKLRWVGANVLYERNTVGDHIAEASNRADDAFEWVKRALNGSLKQEGVTVRDVTVEAAA